MHDSDPSADFTRYRATGDPAALARVFDAVAAEVLRVAGHFAADAAQAEDLVQDTFLAAIESAQRYDPGQPVVPWLLGILVNLVRVARRRGARAPREGARPASIPGPEPAAAAQELEQGVAKALAQIPEPYRDVLRLHLQDELDTAEVARRLDRNPSTVRTQLQRGLEQLRRLLPSGVALAVAPVGPRGLDAVRGTVLERAARSTPAPVVGTAAKAKLGALVLAAGLLAVAPFVIAAARHEAPAASGGEGAAAPAALAADAGAMPIPGEGTAVRVAAAPSVASAGTTLRGRCVAAEDQRPLTGADVSVAANALGDAFRSLAASWSPPPTFTTGADGRFELRLEPTNGLSYDLHVVCTRRGIASRRWSWLEPGRAYELGDVPLTPAYALDGEVVDGEGRPVPNARLTLGRLPAQTHPLLHAAADANGRFTADYIPGPAGTFAVDPSPLWTSATAGKKPLRVVEAPKELRIGAQASAPRIRLVVAPWPAVHGRVVDENERAVEGAVVAVKLTGRLPVREGVATDTEGRFEIACTGAAGAPLDLEVLTGPRCEATPEPVRAAFAAGDVVLRVRRRPEAARRGITLVVREKGTGAPIEDYAAQVWLDPERRGLTGGRWEKSERCPLGKKQIECGAPGTTLVNVAAGAGYCQAHRAWCEVPESGFVDLTVELAPAAGRLVRVVGSDARPVARASLKLLWLDAGVLPHAEMSVGEGKFHSAPPKDRDCLAAALTDGEGHAWLHAERMASRAFLQVAAAGWHSSIVELGAWAESQEPLVITLHQGATLRASLAPAETLKLGPALRLVRVGPLLPGEQGFLMLGQNGTMPFGLDGKLELTGLPAGAFRAELHTNRQTAMFQLPSVLIADCGTVTLEDGKVATLTIDASVALPGSVSGAVTWEGKPLARADGDLEGEGRPGIAPRTIGPIALDEQGKFTVEAVPPGRYRLRLRAGGEVRRHDEWITVRSGVPATVVQAWTLETPVWK